MEDMGQRGKTHRRERYKKERIGMPNNNHLIPFRLEKNPELNMIGKKS